MYSCWSRYYCGCCCCLFILFSHILFLFGFLLEKYCRTVFAVSWAKQLSTRYYRAISMNQPHFVWLTDVMENYDVARGPRKKRAQEREKTVNINWICHRCSKYVKYWLDTVGTLRMKRDSFPRSGVTEKNVEKSFSLFFFLVTAFRASNSLQFVISDSILWPKQACRRRRRCNYYHFCHHFIRE